MVQGASTGSADQCILSALFLIQHFMAQLQNMKCAHLKLTKQQDTT